MWEQDMLNKHNGHWHRHVLAQDDTPTKCSPLGWAGCLLFEDVIFLGINDV